jgi:hypothetical protein
MKKLIAILTLTLLVQANANTDKVVNTQMGADNDARNSQKRINTLADSKDELLREYRVTLKKIENAKVYNDQLRKIIANQEVEQESITKQIETLKETNEGIVPLTLRMAKNLETFVELDVPFLPKERNKRLADLKLMMDRADISTSEKFRRVLEAYQVENEYGRTIEAYRSVQTREGKELTVDFLRIGRVGLFYQSLDGSITARYNPANKTWEDLGSEYRKSIREGLKMARKQMAPQLIKLPIQSPEVI